MTDADRVSAFLRQHGETTPLDWFQPHDGAKPITRLAARVLELRQDGMRIVTVEKRPVARYRWVDHPKFQAEDLREDDDGQFGLRVAA